MSLRPPPPKPQASARATMHLPAFSLTELINCNRFSPGLGSGTFPWGDLYWSPYLTPEPSLIHQPHRMNGERKCFSPKTGRQPLHLNLGKQPSTGSAFYASRRQPLGSLRFYRCHAQLPQAGTRSSRGHQVLICHELEMLF